MAVSTSVVIPLGKEITAPWVDLMVSAMGSSFLSHDSLFFSTVRKTLAVGEDFDVVAELSVVKEMWR